MSPEHALHEASRLLRAGDAASAERALASAWPDSNRAPGPALSILAHVRRAQNRFDEAERLLRRAIALEPDQAMHHAALGDLLLYAGYPQNAVACFDEAVRLKPDLPGVRLNAARAMLAAGKADEAETRARALIADAPDWEAWDVLANILRSQDKFEDALAAADQALALRPQARRARLHRGQVLAKLGRNDEALGEYEALSGAGVNAPGLHLARGVALLNLTRAEAAEQCFADGVRRWPGDAALQSALANVRWMRGAGEGFTRDYEAAVAQAPDDIALRIGCADLARRAGFGVKAESLLREGLARAPQSVALLSSLGVMLDELDRTEEGLPALQRALAQAPHVPDIAANYVCALLRLGRGEEALREIAPARQAQPLNQAWICYESMALRQLGDPRYHELCDYELMVRPFDLSPPAGFRTIEDFNAALREALVQLHVLEAHPLDQSLRNGSQTTRSLLYVADPAIQAYLKALDEPIRAYMDLMRDPDHPWSGRKTGAYRLSGAWSVRLKPGGFHINHLHPEGWISSAYYVQTPESAQGQEGWIKFGEPRWPTPGCGVEKVVQPKPGRLVLFPSYMWHGTIPFSAGERMTAPFDAVPA